MLPEHFLPLPVDSLAAILVRNEEATFPEIYTSGLKNLSIRIYYQNHEIKITREGKTVIFDVDHVNLNAFLLAFGLRGNIRTRKPKETSTFLDQLRNYAEHIRTS